jgi:DNA-binding CsgD family transcriptional regulator
MYSAAMTARQRYDFPLAERLARAAVGAGAGFEAGLLLAQVCWLQGRAKQADQQLLTLIGEATTDVRRALLATARINVLDWGLKHPDAALQVAEQAERSIDDAGCRDQITAERARILGRSGRHGAAVAVAVPLLDRVCGRALVSACFAAGTSMAMTGQASAAIAASERGLAAHLQLTGARLAGESAGAFRDMAWPLWVRNALAIRAHALALRHDVETARTVLCDLDALGVPPSEISGPEVPRARAWTDVAGGDVAQGCIHLHEAAAMAHECGAFTLESAAVHDLARLGHAATATPRLRELAAIVEGPLAPGRAAHAAALASEDAPALESSSAVFDECGAVLLAADASADAAVVWRRNGLLRRAAGAQRRSNVLAARREGARTPGLVTAVPARAALTPRELEIARLAAAGLANKEIAARLCLSHRTVENKLHSAYEKLGVQGRAELARTLETY